MAEAAEFEARLERVSFEVFGVVQGVNFRRCTEKEALRCARAADAASSLGDISLPFLHSPREKLQLRAGWG